MEEEKKVNTDSKDMGLREIATGYIRFSIKADDTVENHQVHEAFKEFCKIETDNNYTQGIRKLLEFYQSDYKTELLKDAIDSVQVSLEDLKASVISLQESKKEDNSKNEEDSDSF